MQDVTAAGGGQMWSERRFWRETLTFKPRRAGQPETSSFPATSCKTQSMGKQPAAPQTPEEPQNQWPQSTGKQFNCSNHHAANMSDAWNK